MLSPTVVLNSFSGSSPAPESLLPEETGAPAERPHQKPPNYDTPTSRNSTRLPTHPMAETQFAPPKHHPNAPDLRAQRPPEISLTIRKLQRPESANSPGLSETCPRHLRKRHRVTPNYPNPHSHPASYTHAKPLQANSPTTHPQNRQPTKTATTPHPTTNPQPHPGPHHPGPRHAGPHEIKPTPPTGATATQTDAETP